VTQWRSIQLPEEVCASAEKKFGSRFQNIEELLTFVLTDLMRDEARQADEAEQRLVEQRLRELGYL
jgi:hypothetical protein